ncbi:MAG: DNA helicase II, partial [Gammaproteobacteria bacterium]
EDQLRTLRRVMKGLEVDEAKWKPQQVQWFINARKDEGLRPSDLTAKDPYTSRMLSIFQAYEEVCRRSGLVDFPELLLRTFETLKRDAALLEHYRERFAHILVDEFQDTNTLQYRWLRLLAGEQGRIFAVGDDDQSIYGWRGARVENILRFKEDLPGVEVLRLEQNYRSTATILRAANALIQHNQGRLGKELWTAGEEGEPIQVYNATDEVDEARFVVERIRAWKGKRSDIAILYRSNAQSRAFEEQLFAQAIPYRVHGGLRFFERAEIKDALAYLRLIANRADDASFERVVNFPTRGIGERTLEKVREIAKARNLSLWEAARAILAERALPTRAHHALEGFLSLIESLARKEKALSELVEAVIMETGLIAHYQKEKGERGRSRVENLRELITAVRPFEGVEEEGLTPLSAFLSHAALEAGEAQETTEDSVQLMTLHAAKGLEFPVVFMAGMEEGLFPSRQSLGEEGRLEEERRLCYVGMTRA